MKKRLDHVLADEFTCAAGITVGEKVVISDDLTVAAISAEAPCGVTGTVCVHETGKLYCTSEGPYRERRDDRVAGEALPVGPFVWGADKKVLQYVPAVRASHVGTTTGPVTVTVDTDDTTKIAVDGESITTTLTAGVGVTFAAIAAEINADLEGYAARVVVNSTGNLVLEATQIGKTVEVETVATDAYTLLGWTEAVYYPSNSSHDPASVAGLVLTAADAEDDIIQTLEY